MGFPVSGGRPCGWCDAWVYERFRRSGCRRPHDPPRRPVVAGAGVSYGVEYHVEAEAIRRTLPAAARRAWAELERRLRYDPWTVGARMSGGLRDTLEAAFAAHGFATYIVQEKRVMVSVINLVWIG